MKIGVWAHMEPLPTLRKQDGMVLLYTMADVVKRQENDVENHELTDFRHESCYQLLDQ